MQSSSSLPLRWILFPTCLLVVMLWSSCCYARLRHTGGTRKRLEFRIAVLLPQDNSFWFSLARVIPAIHLAVETLKNQSDIAHGYDLVVKHRDSKCDIAVSTNEAFNFYLHRDVDIFFGPCCDYSAAPVARQINFWEIPMLTAGALAGDFGYNKLYEYRLMTRIGANFNSLAAFIAATFQRISWRKLKLIYDPFAQADIVPRYCHLAADGLHQYIQKRTNITHDYFKFLNWRHVSEALITELGNEYAMKWAEQRKTPLATLNKHEQWSQPANLLALVWVLKCSRICPFTTGQVVIKKNKRILPQELRVPPSNNYNER